MSVFLGNRDHVLKEVGHELEKRKININRLVPILVSKEYEPEIELPKHVWRGKPTFGYSQATTNNSLIYEPISEKFKVHEIPLSIEESMLKRFIAEHSSGKYVTGDIANKLVLEMSLEDGYYEWLLSGKVGETEGGQGLLNVKDSQKEILSDSKISLEEVKKTILKAYDSINEKGGNPYLPYTLLLPSTMRHIFSDFVSSSLTLSTWLMSEYGIICDFSEKYTHGIMYQTMTGNVFFHKVEGYHFIDAFDPRDKKYISFMNIFGAGLIVVNPKQIINIGTEKQLEAIG